MSEPRATLAPRRTLPLEGRATGDADAESPPGVREPVRLHPLVRRLLQAGLERDTAPHPPEHEAPVLVLARGQEGRGPGCAPDCNVRGSHALDCYLTVLTVSDF